MPLHSVALFCSFGSTLSVQRGRVAGFCFFFFWLSISEGCSSRHGKGSSSVTQHGLYPTYPIYPNSNLFSMTCMCAAAGVILDLSW